MDIIVKECKITICKCLLEKKLGSISDSIWPIYISNIGDLLSIFFYIAKSTSFEMYSKTI